MHSNVIHWRVICLSPLLKKCAKMFLMASRLLAVTHAPLSKQSQSLTLQVQSFVNLQREHLKVVCVFFITRLCRIKNINFNLPMHTLSLMLYHVSLYPCVSDICVSVHLSVSVCLSVCLSLSFSLFSYSFLCTLLEVKVKYIHATTIRICYGALFFFVWVWQSCFLAMMMIFRHSFTSNIFIFKVFPFFSLFFINIFISN